MANSTSKLDLLTAAQSQKEVTANALFDAGSPSMTMGRRALGSGGLTWGYYGGVVNVLGILSGIPNGTITLTANAVNYIELSASGAVSRNLVGFTFGGIPLYAVTTGAATVTSYVDWRTITPLGKFDVQAFYPGIPPASALVTWIPLSRRVFFPIGLLRSIVRARVAATAQTDFLVKREDSTGTVTTFATIRFAAAATTATMIAATSTTFAVGDMFSIVAPATPDATLADIGFVIVGTA